MAQFSNLNHSNKDKMKKYLLILLMPLGIKAQECKCVQIHKRDIVVHKNRYDDDTRSIVDYDSTVVRYQVQFLGLRNPYLSTIRSFALADSIQTRKLTQMIVNMWMLNDPKDQYELDIRDGTVMLYWNSGKVAVSFTDRSGIYDFFLVPKDCAIKLNSL